MYVIPNTANRLNLRSLRFPLETHTCPKNRKLCRDINCIRFLYIAFWESTFN